MGLWKRLWQRDVKREKLVRLIGAKESEILAIYAIGSLVPLNSKNRKRMLQLAKHIKWLHRIYTGLWPWGLNI